MTPESNHQTRRPASANDIWRDLVQSGADSAQIEGFAVEQLIDLQRERTRLSGEGR